MNPQDEHKLERLIHRTLLDLPSRKAPATLEERVMAELARRAALPWWKQSFVHWPVAARAGFVVVSALMIGVLWNATLWAFGGFEAAQLRVAFATQLGWLENARVVLGAVASFFEIILRNIPALWLYGTLTVGAALYAAFFGLGAAAYRSLYAHR
jgi:hypothetical protein